MDEKKIAIFGVGRVGLPLALVLADKGFSEKIGQDYMVASNVMKFLVNKGFAQEAGKLTVEGQKGKPSMIILNTIKGKGASFCEGKVGSHNMPVTKDMAKEAIEGLE